MKQLLKKDLLNIVLDIQDLLSGKEWNSETLDNIADILIHSGFEIKDAIPEQDPTCCDCGKPIGDQESMIRNNGKLSHLEYCR